MMSATTASSPTTEASGAPTTALPILVYVALAGLIQARLVVPGLGAAGRPAALFGLGLMLWWTFSRLIPREDPVRAVPIRPVLFVYFLTFLAAVVAGIDRGLPGIEQRSMDRAVLITLGLGGVVLVAQDTLRTRDDVERVLSWLVAVGAVGAIVALLQFSVGIDLATRLPIPGLVENADQAEIATRGDVGYRRVRGLALHPIEYGVHLAMLLPVALHLAMTSKTATRLRWFAVAVLAGGIPLSISRSGILALAVGLGVYSIGFTWRQRANALVAVVVAGLAFMTVTPGLLGTIKSLFLNARGDDSVAGRTSDFAEVGEFVSERPWFGRGPGTYIPQSYRTLDNQFLATVIETGWVGLAALVLVLLTAVQMAIRLVQRAPTLKDRSLARSLGASVAVAPVTFATFDALGFPIFAGTFIVMVGCLAALYAIQPSFVDRLPDAPLADGLHRV